MNTADILLRSNHIFSGLTDSASPGFVAISGNKILAIGNDDGSSYISESTKVYNMNDQVICPGFSDVHCFFAGYLLTIYGKDLSFCNSSDEVLSQIHEYQSSLVYGSTIICRNLKSNFSSLTREKLDEEFGSVSVILFYNGGECCYMNSAAYVEYNFTPDTCWSESYWKLLKYILNDKEFSVPEFKKYIHMMNSRGVTSTKEMGFDDYYGFTDVLADLEKSNELTMRVHFMSQPVGAAMNLAYGEKMRQKFQGAFVRFSGYNQMTDGSISQLEGDMKEPYLCADTCCTKEIDWNTLRSDVLAADKRDFRFSLHAQGDAAIAKTVEIFSECKKDNNGKIINRHAITDLECSDPADLERMAELGIVAEIYPQIMSIADRVGKTEMIQEKIGDARGNFYWNRRKMQDSGVTISCGTDLPLLYDDIPESIYHSTYALFPEGGEPFNKANTLSVGELLKAWTSNGQYNLGRLDELGTLEEGKLADIAVLNADVFTVPAASIREVKVYMTIVDGKVVYTKDC
ncbi:MAG: amidohydrolase family protein [Lachnospiraceae bacterium]|nr:amidohydrolase family protein [Lachnospiraceae bacterium]